MKRFLTLFITLCLILSACGADTPQTQPTQNPAPAVTPATDAEYIIASDTGKRQLHPDEIEYLNKGIYEIGEYSHIFSYAEQENLNRSGIKIKLKQVYKTDNDNVKITVYFENAAGVSMEKRFDLKLNYIIHRNNGNNSLFSVEPVGAFAYAKGDRMFLSGIGYTEMYDSTDFSLSKKLDYSCIGEKEFYIANFSAFENGYVSAYVAQEKQGLVYFDSEGNFRKHQPLDIKNHRSHFFGCCKESCTDGRLNIPVETEKFSALETKGDLMFFDTYDRLVYDSKANILYTPGKHIELSKNGVTMHLYHVTPVAENIAGGRFLAIKEKGNSVEYFIADTHLTDHSFGYEDKTTVTIENENLLKIYCEVTNCDLVINFGDKTMDFVHRQFAPPENDYDIIAKKNGYTLYSAGGYGGGDISYSAIILREDATGKTKYLDTIGGMYGGNNDTGFFQNGEAYVIDTGGFKIYSTDMSETGHYFRLGDKYPFGENISRDINLRWLLAVRRDPDKKDFIAVYFELPYTDYYGQFKDNTTDSGHMNATYKVGLFDKNGNFIKEYETGEYVDWSYFGVSPLKMYKTGEDTIEFYSTFKGYIASDITSVNVKTGGVKRTHLLANTTESDYLFYGENTADGRRIMYHDNHTGKDTFIRTDRHNTGKANFFKDGNIGILQHDGYVIYNQKGEKQWQLGENSFEFGVGAADEIYERQLLVVNYLYSAYPDTALFCELKTDKQPQKINDYQLDACYKLVMFDENNKVENICETDLNIFNETCRVFVDSPSEGKAAITVYNDYKDVTKGYIDLSNGKYIAQYTCDELL